MEVKKEFNFLYCDATKKIPENSSTVDLVYSSHMIEHFDSQEMQSFFEECDRVLKPNGYLRIVVPDFDYLIDIYNKDSDVDSFIKRSDLVGKKPKSLIKKIQYILQGHGWHHQMFNKRSLEKNLQIQVFQILGFWRHMKLRFLLTQVWIMMSLKKLVYILNVLNHLKINYNFFTYG